MIVTMHGLSTMHCNCATEVRLAAETEYEGIEFLETKIFRYLEHFPASDLKALLDKYKIQARCINALKSVERIGDEREDLLKECETLCAAAKVLECPVIQLVPFEGLEHLPYEESFELTCKNIADIADIGAKYGIRFQLEVIAWAPIHTLQQGLDVIDRVGKDNVGMVVDFWHLYAGEGTTPDDVAKLDKNIITGVHFCDGVKIPRDKPWTSTTELDCRGYLAGEGEIPVKEWCDAVKSTGFDGTWSSELLSSKHWEWDLWDVARKTRDQMLEYGS